MQIQNSQVQTYSYQNSNQTKKSQDENSYSELKAMTENMKAPTRDLIDFIDKNDVFSSLSKEEQELFRNILADDEISTSEVKNLSYEQMAKLNQVFKDSNSATFLIKGFDIFNSANVSSDENFNKSLFETLKNIENPTQRMLFSSKVSGEVGYNRPRLPFEKPIEQEIEERIAFEKEKYKDFPNKDEIMANLIKELKNWKITDYGSFIDKTLFQLKKDISNPAISQDGRYNLLKQLPYYEDLQKNYNQIQTKQK